MPSPEDLRRWREVYSGLLRGVVPRGEAFDLCRSLLAVAPGSPEAAGAARTLLEGAMADAATPIDDAQEVMRMLRALDRKELAVGEILAP